MKKRIRDEEDMPSDHARVVRDYLPPPQDLVPRGSKLKVTLELDEESVNFFKEQARHHGGKYQRMMREVLRHYALHHTGKNAA